MIASISSFHKYKAWAYLFDIVGLGCLDSKYNKIVYYKSLSDSNWNENDYTWAFFIQTKFCFWGAGREQNIVMNNKYDQLLSF